jgi:hypothetical protein
VRPAAPRILGFWQVSGVGPAESGAADLLRGQLTGYGQATTLVSTRGRLTINPDGIVARLNNRTYSPVLRTAKIPPTPIPGGTTAPSPSRSDHPRQRHRGRLPVQNSS